MPMQSIETKSWTTRAKRDNPALTQPGLYIERVDVQHSLFLPHMKKKSEQQGAMDGETLKEFWVVDDMYTFENVGFTNTVNDIKYLICADCEVGPIGWHDLSKKKEFYIALDRVHHI
ncbi:guanine nucleotide exchange factor MSS4-like isoform X2 [Saccoglossus kowalevskii]